MQEVTVSRADVKEISVDAVVAVVLSELDDIFALKGRQITGRRVFPDMFLLNTSLSLLVKQRSASRLAIWTAMCG